jgi:cullin 3
LPQHGPDTNVQETWDKLAYAIREIQNERAFQLSYEENYRYAYHLVLYRQGDFLYTNVKALITEHLARIVQELVVPAFGTGKREDPVIRAQEGELLMKAVRNVWDKHNSSMRKLSDILKYMASSTSSDPHRSHILYHRIGCMLSITTSLL